MGLYPQHLGDTGAGSSVFFCGFCSPDSFGANAYFVRRPDGNLLVDSPRFTRGLVKSIGARGGLAHVLLTHRDDVADADRWAAEFSARVWIHDDDRGAAPFATDLVRGRDPAPIAPGVTVIPTPGHTRGSVVFLVDDEALFTGDSLYYSRTLGRLSAFADVCWYSWREQTASIERLAGHRFSWVLAGHGDRHRGDAAAMHEQIVELARRMRERPRDEGDW